MLKGRATADATRAYAARFTNFPANYKPSIAGLSISSLGIGTYLGDEQPAVDAAYSEAIRAALLGGINLIDTAVNYRFQLSERVIGKVIGQLVGTGRLKREEVVVATKGGYIPFDSEPPSDPGAWIEENYLRRGIVRATDIVQGSHCMTPRYLEAMLETSRANLQLETIDFYYLHNPESQLSAVSREEFRGRLKDAFRFFEGAVKAGKIGLYGAATWNGFRVAPNDPSYLPLTELVNVATEVGGQDHHFRVVQLPYNLAMTEALTLANQRLSGAENVSLLAAADTLGVGVCASASLLQGRLTSRLPEALRGAFPGLDSDAQRSIQFVRSTPGVDVALVGMSSAAHVAHNLATLKHPPATFDALMKLFRRADS